MLTLTRTPPCELVCLFHTFAERWIDLHELWNRIKPKRAEEAFTELQLPQMVRPYLKERGLSRNLIYYLHHREEQKEGVRRHKFKQIDDKNDPIKTSAASKVPRRGNLLHFEDILPSSCWAYESLSVKEVEMVEFDVGCARDCLKEVIEKADGDKSRIWMVRIYARNAFLRAIQIKFLFSRNLFGMKTRSDRRNGSDAASQDKSRHLYYANWDRSRARVKMGNLHLLQKVETVTEDDASNESLCYLHNPKLLFIESKLLHQFRLFVYDYIHFREAGSV